MARANSTVQREALRVFESERRVFAMDGRDTELHPGQFTFFEDETREEPRPLAPIEKLRDPKQNPWDTFMVAYQPLNGDRALLTPTQFGNGLVETGIVETGADADATYGEELGRSLGVLALDEIKGVAA